jgi:hypothetical protein
MDTRKKEKERESILGASRTSKRARGTESNSPSSDDNNRETEEWIQKARERYRVFLERLEQARKRERERATIPSVTAPIERHKQARERDKVSLERFEQARKRERQRATIPSVTKRIEREKRIQEKFSFELLEQARERERQRATTPAVAKRIERQRKFPWSEEDRQE